MTFRTKLFVIFTLALLVCIGLVAAGVSRITRHANDELHSQYTSAAMAQFQREFARQRSEVLQRVEVIADAEGTVRMAIDLSRPQTDMSIYVNDAHGVSQAHHLDFLDFVASDGSIISSAEWSAHFGNKLAWVMQPDNWASVGAFLMKVDTQDGPQLGLMAVSTVRVGDKNLYVVGGERLGKEFLASVVLPAGIRAFLYENMSAGFQPANLTDESGVVGQPEQFTPFIEKEREQPSEQTFKISWTRAATSVEEFHALPLLGRQKDLLGVLLVGSSLRDVVTMERRIRLVALGVVAIGVFFGILLSAWAVARVTRPILAITQGAKEVSEGNWGTRVTPRGPREFRRLANAFNEMTRHLTEQREKLVQNERVAAWREVAHRLGQELNTTLLSLQTAAENLARVEEENPAETTRAFREALPTIHAGLEKLKSIVVRFSDFAKPPELHFQPVNLNEIVRDVVRDFEGQFSAVGRPPISSELHLEERLPVIQGDSVLLHKGIENLILNAMDAMPSGGVLMLRTTHEDGEVELEVSDTGKGLTPGESSRLFSAEETERKYGSELTLATVQSVVADHGGRIHTESEAGVGTSFHIHLPRKTADHPDDSPIVTEAEESNGTASGRATH